MVDSLAVESNRLFAHAWSRFAEQAARGEVVSTPELVFAWANAESPMLNMAFCVGPLTTEAELRARAAEASAFADGAGPSLALHDLPRRRGRAAPAGDRANPGLGRSFPSLETTGMTTDALEAPRRPPPAIEYRGLHEIEVRRDVARINAEAYAAPAEIFLAPIDAGVLDRADEYGLVGYLGGEAVTCSNTSPVDDVLYVSWVATRPGLERRGLAEAVMRRSLANAARKDGPRAHGAPRERRGLSALSLDGVSPRRLVPKFYARSALNNRRGLSLGRGFGYSPLP